MQNRSFYFSLSGVAVLIVAAALYISDGLPTSESDALASANSSGSTHGGRGEDSFSPGERAARQKSALINSPGQNQPNPLPGTQPPTIEKYWEFARKPDWERDIIKLADRRDISDEDKAVQLLAKVNHLPDEAKVVAMEYATKLIPDERYAGMRSWVFQLASTDELRETVMLDALTRADSVRMPTLVEMLRQPKNPAQEEVKEVLMAYFDVDHGDDVNKWDAAVKQWMRENPEE